MLENSEGSWRHDQHHCRCFSISRSCVNLLWSGLRGLGFAEQILEMDHGQAWGLRRKTSEIEQIHVKAMPDGRIESEMEPQPEYPIAHINPAHSYSPHREVGRLLSKLRIPFQRVVNVPSTCWRPIVILPKSLIHWKTLACIALLVLAAGFIAYAVWKRRS